MMALARERAVVSALPSLQASKTLLSQTMMPSSAGATAVGTGHKQPEHSCSEDDQALLTEAGDQRGHEQRHSEDNPQDRPRLRRFGEIVGSARLEVVVDDCCHRFAIATFEAGDSLRIRQFEFLDEIAEALLVAAAPRATRG
jgi:hypothetical protein